MDEYGLVSEPGQPDEAFEALSDTMGDKVFTFAEATSAISDVLGISSGDAKMQFDKLVRNGNVRELTA